MRVRYSGNKFD